MSAYLPRAASAYLPRAAIKAATPAEHMYVREFVYLLNSSSKGPAMKCPICSNRISVGTVWKDEILKNKGYWSLDIEIFCNLQVF